MAMAMLPDNEPVTKDNDHHLEIFSLIWLDADDNIEDNQTTEQKLRTIINHFKRFRNAKECQQYIEKLSEQDRLVLIVSRQLAQEIISSIHLLRQVSSIYIYCRDEKNNEEWTKNFTKVKRYYSVSICSD
jgi:hypothetical protein